LCFAASLIGHALRLRLCIFRRATNAFLHFTAEIPSRSFKPIFIHSDLLFEKT
jgi:hypothetical protein